LSEIGSGGRAIRIARNFAMVAGAAFTLLAATASTSLASHANVGFRFENSRMYYVAGHGETNLVTVNEVGASYTLTDAGLTSIPVAGPLGACVVTGNAATCPAADVDRVSAAVFDGNDTVTMNVAPRKGTILRGGAGHDTLTGGAGPDDVGGGDGDDTIDSGLGRDLVVGDSGYNTLTFASRTGPVRIDKRDDIAYDADGIADVILNLTELVGTPFDDEIVGGHQAEVLVGLGGSDYLCGGLGVDTVDYSSSTAPVQVTLDGLDAIDTSGADPPLGSTDPDLAIQLVPEPGQNGDALRQRYLRARHDCRQSDPNNPQGGPVPGGWRDCTPDDGVLDENDCVGEDVENIIGSDFDDILVGNNVDPLDGRGPRVEPLGANLIEGRGGNDVMDGRGGPDVYDGGDGVDVVTYGGLTTRLDPRVFSSRTTGVNATIDGAPNDGGVEDRNRAVLSDSIDTDVETIIGGDAGDTIRGGPGAETLLGGLGNDVIDGEGGGDRIDGGGGNDSLAGGDDGDTVTGGEGDDFMDGERGRDDVRGEAGNDTIAGGDDLVANGSGADALLSGGEGDDTLDYTDATTALHVALDGVNNDGIAGEGDQAADDFEVVRGGIADDTLIGGAAGQLLQGNDGDDTLVGGGGADIFSGGPGADTASYADRGTPVYVNLAEPGNDGAPDEADHVAEDVEKVLGGSGDDVLFGDGRANVLLGAAGNDRLSGAEGDDLLIGDAGNDNIAGDVGNDTLLGSDGNDALSGAGGNDDLKGESGNDTLDGGTGRDRLTGGPHVDTLLYSARSAGVTVVLEGKDGNGERNENDFINHDVENVTTGSGNDTIDADDNLKGEVKCGAGSDLVTADPDDRIAGDCENVRVSALGTRCTLSKNKVTMSKSGAIKVRLFCAVTAKGTVRLQSAVGVRVGSRRKVVKIGSKSFSLKAGQRKTITVKASKVARRVIRRKKRLSVRGRVSAKTPAKKSATESSTVFTVRGPR
jgi:Ca2+-binding RTX toxin-like protein